MIKVFDPEITGEDEAAVASCLARGELSGRSPIVATFEVAFAQYCGVKHAIAVNSGSSALFLALVALDLPRGSRVIVPTFGYIAVPNAVIQAGYVPVFVDIDRSTGNISLKLLEKELKKGDIRAIIVIHTYGFPVNISSLREVLDIPIIEDAAEAHGAEIEGYKVGSMSDMGCFSFFANKIITTGEGGMVTTDNDTLATRLRSLRDQFNGSKRYYHEDMGYSLCMTALGAALGLSQLARIGEIIAKKRAIAARYYRGLANVVPLTADEGTNPVYWAFGILTDRRDEMIEYLALKGIEARPFFTAYHNNPFYLGAPMAQGAEYLQNHGVYLPSSHTLTIEDQNYVIERVNKFR